MAVQTTDVLYNKVSRYNISGNEEGFVMEDFKKYNLKRLFVRERNIDRNLLHRGFMAMHACGG